MGAQVFQRAWFGLDAKTAYKEATEDAVYNGLHPNALHGKGGLSRVSLPANIKNEASAFDYIDKLMEQNAYNDKWGNMFYVEIPNATVKEVSVISGVKTIKNEKKGVKKWINVITVKFHIPCEHNHQEKEFTDIKSANDFAKEKVLQGFYVSIETAKKLSDPGLANICKMEPTYKRVKQKQNLYIFFGFYPT